MKVKGKVVKMYKIKRLLLIILSISMIFSTACDTKKEPEEIQPSEISYKQIVIGQQSGMKCTGKLCLTPDNKLIVCDYSNSKPKYFIFDTAGALINAFESDFEGDGNAFTVDKDGQLYILAQKFLKDKDDKIYEKLLDIYIYDLEGKLQTTIPLGRIPISQENTALITEIEIDKDKHIYALVKGQRIEVFDSNGSSTDTIVSQNSKSMCLDGSGGLIIAGKDMNAPNIKKINPVNKNKSWFVDVKSDIQRLRFRDSIYALDNSGITRYHTDGKKKNLSLI